MSLETAVNSPEAIPALSYDLAFPEVFYTTGVPHGKQGFHVVLGNPPWDAVRPKAKEFFASFDFAILDAPTKRERTIIEKRLNDDPLIAAFHKQYEEGITEQQRTHDVLFEHQVVEVNGEKTGGNPDLAKLFLERGPQLLRSGGLIGLLVPSAFHANEGATGVRRLYLEKLNLRHCYSFENRRKLFEIDSRFKFATVVAQAGKPTEEVSCAFYLHEDEWLFGARNGREPLHYQLDFIRQTGGDYLSLLELRSSKDLKVAEVCFSNDEPFGNACNRLGIRLGREFHMTDDAWRFTPTAEVLSNGDDPRDPDVAARLLDMGYLVLHEGKTFRQYDDHWGARPRYVVALSNLEDKPIVLRRTRYYRVGYRDIAGPGDENVSIFNLHPPGITTGNTAPLEAEPYSRGDAVALSTLAICNSHVFDWLLQLRVRAHVNLFILLATPIPRQRSGALMAHSALRLSCTHIGYAPLWREQVGATWREPNQSPFTWPVLATDEERWTVRAVIDAAYGLSHAQYAHVLSIFKHTSNPKAPELCLSKFDELKAIGLDAFTRKHDPYWDIPLNENLPQPVIDLPIPGGSESQDRPETNDRAFQLSDTVPQTRRKRKR